jgi:hypothetical protein
MKNFNSVDPGLQKTTRRRPRIGRKSLPPQRMNDAG